jgi:DNA-binding transcriptional ArsR family regulator
MDRASVAHLFGTCFAEALRERVGNNGGVGSGKLAAELGREHRIPAEYIERVTGYAASIGAIEAREFADGSEVFEYTDSYQQTTRQNLAIDAGRAAERGDYAVSYAPADQRPRTPAVLFPETTKDTVTAGEAEAAPTDSKTTRSGPDQCELWYKDRLRRRQENARIIAVSPAPQRKDYTADRLAAYREQIADRTGSNASRYSRKHMQTGDENTRRAAVRGKHWTETDRLINWLYHRPGQAQEIKSLYYERGAHSPEDQETLRAALNELREAGKITRNRRGGRVIASLRDGVKPRNYTRPETEETPEYQEEAETEEPEQSFDPQVMAEMSAAGASYTEVWDS